MTLDAKDIVSNSIISYGSLFPLSVEGKQFSKEYSNGISPRLPSSKIALKIYSSCVLFLQPGTDEQYNAGHELSEVNNLIHEIYDTSQKDLQQITDYLRPLIGKEITVLNRFGKDKKVRLFSVSNPMIYFGFGNHGFPGTTFVEIVISS